ncbi:hypothetical protein BB559_005603 [Furculomyces boomerangus]|uniref:Tyrosinase copper-binding domain-containing protein n=2 Tax=Harpellales TaxID=61421 RepID=A0A2T9Y7Q6_9FUNG|nr:hypothetical protein BB559_005603 [Furculomyces boomerangus]PVZ96793.1 hypothetical protein BB558_007277 [Smittium angustum]
MVKLGSICLVLVSSLLSTFTLGQQNQQRCANILTRREIRSIPQGEWQNYRNALNRMRDDGWFTWYARMHTQNFNIVHNNPMFFPFHRRIVQDFERLARTYYPGFVMPYYDAARDFNSPHASAALSAAYLGGNGVGPQGCLQSGIQAGWSINFPANRCLRRVFNGGGGTIQPWYSPAFIESMIQRETSLDRFRNSLEFSLHGAVHLGLGGDMGAMEAPNDFTFMLHHANLDRIWWRWQVINQQNMWKYDGNSPNRGPVSLNDPITVYGDSVGSVMQLGFGKMCFEYDSQPIRGNLSKRQEDTDSGNSTGDLSGDDFIKALDSDTLAKYFPVFAQNQGNTTSNRKSRTLSTYSDRPAKRMPYPFKLDESWLKMHGYSLVTAENVRQGAIKMVDDLYNSGYRCPYL